MIPANFVKVRAVIERINREDETIATNRRLHAARKQEAQRERAEALAERVRLADADRLGTLTKVTHGHDDNGNATIEKQRDVKRLQAADARLAEIDRNIAAFADEAQVSRLSKTRILLELAKLGPCIKLIEVDRPSLPLHKNERAIDALPRFRQASLDLIEEYKATQKAAMTKVEVCKKAHAEIDRLADRGLPKTMRMYHGGSIDWAQHEILQSGDTMQRIPDALALVAFLLRDKLKSEVDKLLEFNASGFPDAMTADEKAARLSELEAEISAAERIEAACVEQIITEGGHAHHRPDADVLGVLSLGIAP